ncbi:MAG: hypothetical protein RJA15_967 [Actinomycetota bacterium]
MNGDPLLPNDWHEDPWDDVAVLDEQSVANEAPSFDQLRGPAKRLVAVLVASVLLLGVAGWWVVHALNPSGEPGVAINFTVNEGDTLDSVASRLDDAGIIGNATLFRWYASTKADVKLVPGYYALRPKDNAGYFLLSHFLKE